MLSDETPSLLPSAAPLNPVTPSFVGRVLIVVAIVALAVALVQLRAVLVLSFGCVLVAVALHSGSNGLRHLTGLGDRGALAAVVVGVLGLLGVGIWLLGEPMAEQFGALRQALPKALDAITRWLNSHTVGLWLLQWWNGADSAVEWTRVAGVFGSTVGAFGSALLMGVVGLYLAADPTLYRRGLIALMPKRHRARVDRALGDAGDGLSRWLLGQSIAMLVVGLMTAAGLALIGMPLALPLGIIAGLLEFIPFLGTFASGALIVLLAFTQGAPQAVYALGVCVFVQQFEGYVIQPFVQRWAIALPPALGLLSVIVFGVLFGMLGVVFAVPLMVVLMLLVQRLYVEGALHDGDSAARRGNSDCHARKPAAPAMAAPTARGETE